MPINSLLPRLPGGWLLARAKDKFLAGRAIEALNALIGRYGKILEFELNSLEKSAFLSLLLIGEESPVEIRVRRYALVREGKRLSIEIDGGTVETSREWLTRLIQDKVHHQKFPVPEEHSWILERLI